MKIIPSSKKRHALARVSIFLIMLALITGMSGCAESYSLNISSTTGGSVTIPGEGAFTYSPGTMAPLSAEAEEDYQFIEWTGDVGTIADIYAASTNITMNGNYSITANFGIEMIHEGEIYNWYHLDAVRDNLGGNYTLMNDLDSNTAGYDELASPTANEVFGWQPIGTEDDLFTGTFDGQGYEICDLFINRPAEWYVGLFGVVDERAQIEDTGVVDADVIGEDAVGGLVGVCYGNVTDSYFTGSVTSEADVGGLVGWNQGIVSNSHATGTVIGAFVFVGGLVGVNDGTVTNSYSTCSVTAYGSAIGGLVGGNGYSSSGTVSNSYSTGSVTGKDGVGGLVGANWPEGNVSDCYATGNVDGDREVGGLVGGSAGTVSDSYSTGNVTGVTDVGGLMGLNAAGFVNNSFWDTETSGQATSDGGTGKNTTEMQDIATFSVAGWDISEVALNETNPTYIWNIVNNVTYPFLGWQL